MADEVSCVADYTDIVFMSVWVRGMITVLCGARNDIMERR
jgi:hypothetical protein